MSIFDTLKFDNIEIGDLQSVDEMTIVPILGGDRGDVAKPESLSFRSTTSYGTMVFENNEYSSIEIHTFPYFDISPFQLSTCLVNSSIKLLHISLYLSLISYAILIILLPNVILYYLICDVNTFKQSFCNLS